MSLLTRLRHAWAGLRADAGPGTWLPPDSDFWYNTPGYGTATGLRVSPETALRVAAVYACVRVVAETVASLPLVIYRALPDGGKERALNHPLYKVLHDKPNQWQTSYEWLEMMQAHLELRGNAFSRIVPGPNGAVDQLIPLHPDRVQVYRLPDGKLKYQVRSFYSAEVDYYLQEEMFHLRGLSSDGLVGMSTVALAAETIGCALAGQEFAARYFENDATPSGVFTHPKVVTEEAYKRLKQSIQEAQTGSNRHKAMVLEEGMTYEKMGMTNKDSQLLEAREFSRSDIASCFRVPPHKIGDLSRATFSNIEQQNIEFATDCIRPRLVRFERRLNTDLIDPLELEDGSNYFAEFLMDALLRGDIKSRYEAYSQGISAGFLTRNEPRRMENLNPIAGLDEPLMPLNMAPVGQQPTEQGGQTVSPEDSTGRGGASQQYLRDLVRANAERVVRKEVKALSRLAEQSLNGQLEAAVKDFYTSHRQFVAESMRISSELAREYVEHNQALMLEEYTAAIGVIEREGGERLANLALRSSKTHISASQSPVQVTIEPQTIHVSPNISILPQAAAPSQPIDVKIAMESTKGNRKVVAVRQPDGSMTATVTEEPSVSQFIAKREADGSFVTLEEKQNGTQH